MDVKILGTGCARCVALETATRAAIERLGLVATVNHVTDAGEIASWGVMSTPALVVDDEVVVAGRLPTDDELANLLAGRGR